MPNLRATSVFLILLSSGISVLFGLLANRASPGGTANYRAVYYGARCLIHGDDPYQPGEFLRIYNAESGLAPSDPFTRFLFLRATTVCVNLPTTLFLVAALAMLPWGISHLLWLALIAVSLTLAAFSMFDLAAPYAPRMSLFLICILLANSEVLYAVGNTAGLAVSLCVTAVWCFVKKRYEWFGILGLAISLSLKPHDSGLVWLFLLVAGGALRKRALQSMALTILLAVPSLLWVSHVAPGWPHELSANLAQTSAPGDISDPGPRSISRRGSADVIIDLQTVLSLLRDNPRAYNLASIALCAFLLGILVFAALRRSTAPMDIWYGLAAIAAVSMLPSYHRPYDARLLLLAVPASAMMWGRGCRLGRVGAVLTGLAVTFTGDIPLAILSLLTRNIDVTQMGLAARLLTVGLLRPAPLALLAVAVFFTWVYARAAIGTGTGGKAGKTSDEAPLSQTSTPDHAQHAMWRCSSVPLVEGSRG